MKHNLFPDYRPACQRLVCIDSDGCAFDTMELKHKECFCPATVQAWGLQAISKFVREAWEYCNLYSKDRGRSRFHELILVFDLLSEREEVKEYDFELPDITSFKHWVATTPVLNNEELAKHQDDPVLQRALRWSLEMNRRVEEMVQGVPPFPGVVETLKQLQGQADIAIVSATPKEAVRREWAEHDLMQYVSVACAQEDGNKTQCIQSLAKHYAPNQVLMIGDAPGDLEAARASGALFFPILPGDELHSWKQFASTGVRHFLNGSFAGAYEQERIEAFDNSLPDSPPWRR
ncbi:MAG: HAD family hydrolase [Clostridiales bacterium]|nr:HAD family hydrolase [Clostridiales bacterium]